MPMYWPLLLLLIMFTFITFSTIIYFFPLYSSLQLSHPTNSILIHHSWYWKW